MDLITSILALGYQDAVLIQTLALLKIIALAAEVVRFLAEVRALIVPI
jgi:hypothetical protein